MTTVITRDIRAAVGAALLGALLSAGPSASAAPARDDADVPVLGQQIVTPRTTAAENNPDMIVTLHGVRRFDGGTAIYYSAAGAQKDGPRDAPGTSAWMPWPSANSNLIGRALVLDPRGRRAFMALPKPGEGGGTECLCSYLDWIGDGEPQALVGAIVVAPIPADLRTVDVMVAGAVFKNAPVEDGLLEPMAESDSPVLGTGWPTVDAAAAKQSSAQVGDKAVTTFSFPVKDLRAGVTQKSTKDTTTLDVQADILFAFDKAELGPQADAAIDAIVQKMKDQGITSGTVKVLGYTDSQGDDSRNATLSKERAEAVAARLKAKVPGVMFQAEGKSGADPVADNATEEGRRLNRRVEVVLPKGEK